MNEASPGMFRSTPGGSVCTVAGTGLGSLIAFRAVVTLLRSASSRPASPATAATPAVAALAARKPRRAGSAGPEGPGAPASQSRP